MKIYKNQVGKKNNSFVQVKFSYLILINIYIILKWLPDNIYSIY